MTEPIKAVDAILDTEFEVDGMHIYPLSLGRYALLELLDSPFINAAFEFTVPNVVPSLYVMTNDIKKLAKYNSKNIDGLKSEAMLWAEEVPTKNLDKVISAILTRVKQLNDVAPQGGGDDNSTEKKTSD